MLISCHKVVSVKKGTLLVSAKQMLIQQKNLVLTKPTLNAR